MRKLIGVIGVITVLASTGSASAEEPAGEGASSKPQVISEIEKLQESVKKLEDTVAKSGLLKGDQESLQNHTSCGMDNGVCAPDEISVNGDTKSVVALTAVPPEACLVTASANESFAGENADLGFDCIGKPLPDTLDISLHMKTFFLPSFGGFRGSSTAAHKRLRPQGSGERCLPRKSVGDGWPPRDGLSLLLHPSMGGIVVTTYGQAADGSCTKVLKSARVGIRYPRWEVGAGGFYAFTYLGSEELVQSKVAKPADAPADSKDKFSIVRKDSRSLQTATGISFNIYPANYPSLGLMFGYTDRGDESPTYYFGGGVRLRSLGRHAVMSIMGGYATGKIKTFPGVSAGDVLEDGDPLLAGRERYEVKPFASIHIGFTFGGTRSNGS